MSDFSERRERQGHCERKIIKSFPLSGMLLQLRERAWCVVNTSQMVCEVEKYVQESFCELS